MNKKLQIKRGDLLMTQDFEEPFVSYLGSESATVVISSGGDYAHISIHPSDGGSEFSVAIDDEDAARFAQAIMLMSGVAEVVDE